MAIDFKRQQFFWSRTEKAPGGHIVWTGANVPRGYGKMLIEGKEEYAHRVAWCMGKNIDLRDIEHLRIRVDCERRDCVNIDHLSSVAKVRRNTDEE